MIIALDVETGGLDPRRHALLSISACQLDNTDKTFNVFIEPEPGLSVDPRAAKINGYTPSKWEQRGAVTLSEALIRFKAWLPHSWADPLAHNVSFDKAFLEAAQERTAVRLYFNRRWRCSMSLFMGVSEALKLDVPNFQLVTLAEQCGHWNKDYFREYHESLNDAIACAKGWQWLIEKIKEGSYTTGILY